jgi:hypothetical protein
VNLCILTLIWLTCGFNHAVISFRLKYVPGNIYWNGVLNGLSDLLGYVVAGVVQSSVGIQRTF